MNHQLLGPKLPERFELTLKVDIQPAEALYWQGAKDGGLAVGLALIVLYLWRRKGA